MSSFKNLQARHEELIGKAQSNEDVLDQVQGLIADIQRESANISSSSERDQLRSNLRYWASYVYEKTGAYPNVDLSPAAAPSRPRWIIPAVTVGVLVLILGGVLVSFRENPMPTQVLPPPATEKVSSTSASAQLTDLPSLPTFSLTMTEQPSATPTQVEATAVGAMAIVIVSPSEGDEISPFPTLNGTYSNLPQGYTIHAVVQPLSGSDLLYPMEQYATVSPNNPAGAWEIKGPLVQGSEMKEQEKYKLQMVAAMNDEARQALLDAVRTGMKTLPAGVIPFPQTITVTRNAPTEYVQGIRLLYSSFLDYEGNWEIFTAKTDGSDIRRITYTSGFNEYFPSLSPDGLRIAYVGRRQNENNVLVQSIEVMSSDGTNPGVILENDTNISYERPLWSSDGKYLAYVAGEPQENKPTVWGIYAQEWDADRGEKVDQPPTLITKGVKGSNRYFCWIPGTHEIVFDARTPETKGTSGFMKVDVEKPGKTSLYFDDDFDEVQPAVSPDGKSLAYVQFDTNNVNHIRVADLTTGKIVQLGQGLSPVWDPELDKGVLYYESASNSGDYISIWSVDTGTKRVTQLTFGKDRYPFAGNIYAMIPK
jgi:Tol biopolymer transport system component